MKYTLLPLSAALADAQEFLLLRGFVMKRSLFSTSVTVLSLTAGVAQADFRFLDDLIVDGSLCVGTQCILNEAFRTDTLRLKETNTRIHFDDTSVSGYPSRDWRIEANSLFRNGGEYFRIIDATNSRPVFWIEGNTRASALVVDDEGDVGMGTAFPARSLHIVDGFKPSIRLQQDGSGGLIPTTWDISTETNPFLVDGFYVQNITRGTTPFILDREAPTGAIAVSNDGDIGFGVYQDLGIAEQPQAPVHILRFNGTSSIRVEDRGGANGNMTMLHMVNNSGRAQIEFESRGAPAASGNWLLSSGSEFVLEDRINSQNVMVIDQKGNMQITGGLTTSGSCSVGCDRVFDADYELMSVEKHTAAMWELGHLPNVGPTPEDAPFNISDKVGRILNELEHAHIYIGELHAQAEQDRQEIAELKDENASLRIEFQTEIAQLSKRLEKLEPD